MQILLSPIPVFGLIKALNYDEGMLPSLFHSSYNPFDGPNENPEAELPLTAGKYLYVYGDMDEDGFYEGTLGIVFSVSLQACKT